MVALLLSFGANPKGLKESTASSDRSAALVAAEAKAFHDQGVELQQTFSVILQSWRQQGSCFNKIDLACANLVATFLSLPSDCPLPSPSIKSTRDFMTKISAKCLLNSSAGFFNYHSPAAKTFLEELKKITDSHSVTTEKVSQAVSKFKETNPKKNSNTAGLLKLYKLDSEEKVFRPH